MLFEIHDVPFQFNILGEYCLFTCLDLLVDPVLLHFVCSASLKQYSKFPLLLPLSYLLGIFSVLNLCLLGMCTCFLYLYYCLVAVVWLLIPQTCCSIGYFKPGYLRKGRIVAL